MENGSIEILQGIIIIIVAACFAALMIYCIFGGCGGQDEDWHV